MFKSARIRISVPKNYSPLYSVLQKFKTTPDFAHIWHIIVFSMRNKRVEKFFGTSHDPLVLSSSFINQLFIYGCL